MDRRHELRTRTLKSARILLNHHQSVIDCVVRNLSPTGACLKVETTLGIPDRFDKSIRPGRLAWYKENQLGVEFDTAHNVAAA